MESKNSIHDAVKRSDSENAKKVRANHRRISALEIGDARTFSNYLRILGYINGAWEKSHGTLDYLVWSSARFSRKTGTGGKRKIAERTLDRVMPKFQRWCGEYFFHKVNVGGVWELRITRNPAIVAAVPGSQVRDRLVAAIRSHVAKAGQAKVDLEWCRKFSEICRLPLNAIETAWRNLKKIDGLKHKWRGVGRGRKYVAEDPAVWVKICAERERRKTEKLSGLNRKLHGRSAFLRNDKIQNSGPPDRVHTESARAAPASEDASDNTGRSPPAPAEPGGFEPSGNKPHFGRWFPGCEPLQICGRLIQPKRLRALANWVAGQRLKFVHAEFPRVQFVFGYAQKFAHNAIKFGYAVPAIETAWRLGVARSHADAVDANDDLERPRLPSAAQAYAWNFLRGADPRSSEMLWAEFFASPRREYAKRDDTPTADDRTAKSGNGEISAARKPRVSAEDRQAVLSALREKMADVGQAPVWNETELGLTIGDMSAYLKAKIGMTMATFAAMPYVQRAGLIRRAATWKKSREDRPQKPGERFLDHD